ncbi:MAG: glycosyltransferase [bacterium]
MFLPSMEGILCLGDCHVTVKPMNALKPLRVAVLIDHRPNHPGEVGGLAGTWEQLSLEAAGREDLELTLFFLGDEPRVERPAPNLKRVLMRPALGTEALPFLSSIPTHTDLAPMHPGLFRSLRGFHVIHSTEAFYAFAKTGLWASRIRKIPLVNSIQTDIISWAGVYTPGILHRILPGPAACWLLNRYGFLERQKRSMERKLARYMRACSAVLVSHQKDIVRLSRLAPHTPLYFLRRGIDLSLFHPGRKDKELLLQRFGIPGNRRLLLFVGRMDQVKGVMIAAKVVKELAEQGLEVHLVAVGNGSQKGEVAKLLGDRVTLTGNLPHGELGWIYASAELLLFPSEAEVWPNVVTEAKASGLPVLACVQGARHVMLGDGQDGLLLVDRDLQRWVNCTRELLSNRALLKKMGEKARQHAQTHYPSWTQVMEEDVLPVWREVAEGSFSCSLGASFQS